MKKFLKIIRNIIALPIDICILAASSVVLLLGLITSAIKGDIKQELLNRKSDFKIIRAMVKELASGYDVKLVMSKGIFSTSGYSFEHIYEKRTKDYVEKTTK